MNVVVEESRDCITMANFRQVHNKRGYRTIEPCRSHSLLLTNTLFQKEKRKLYKWTVSENVDGHQLGYIMFRECYCNEVKSSMI